jgi:beta-lactamase superfamily II metal-dependent hydrolase
VREVPHALVSAARHNLFGYPAQTTLTTLQQIGTTVYRTVDAVHYTLPGGAT